MPPIPEDTINPLLDHYCSMVMQYDGFQEDYFERPRRRKLSRLKADTEVGHTEDLHISLDYPPAIIFNFDYVFSFVANLSDPNSEILIAERLEDGLSRNDFSKWEKVDPDL